MHIAFRFLHIFRQVYMQKLFYIPFGMMSSMKCSRFGTAILHARFSLKSVFVFIRLRQIAVVENILHIIVILKVFQHPVDLFEIILGNIDGV